MATFGDDFLTPWVWEIVQQRAFWNDSYDDDEDNDDHGAKNLIFIEHNRA